MRIIIFFSDDRFERAFLIEPPSEKTFGVAVIENTDISLVVDFYEYLPYSSLLWELL
jgi:hypothetical protein